MKKIQIEKVEAARRQIDAAIRWLFAKGDPVAIFTVASAGYRILRDIAEIRGNVGIHQSQKDIIRPGKEKEYWKFINAPVNFLKHAEKDPDATFQGFKEEYIDVTISIACLYYHGLGYKITTEMHLFSVWYMIQHPNIIKDTAPIKGIIIDELPFVKNMSRYARLEVGRLLLEKAGIYKKYIKGG